METIRVEQTTTMVRNKKEGENKGRIAARRECYIKDTVRSNTGRQRRKSTGGTRRMSTRF